MVENSPWTNQIMNYVGMKNTEQINKPATMTGFGTALAGVQGVSNTLSSFAPGAGGTGGAAAGLTSLQGMIPSDIRVKENIETIESALDKVEQLSGKTYNYKFNDPTTRDGGVIAQDLEKILPEAVVTVDDIKYVKYEAVIGLLVNAVNELARKVG